MKERLRLLRPKHYLKNLLVFFPLVFSGRMTDCASAAQAGFAFLAFCLLASAVYILNDLCDRENDRRHPRKCLRPLASGAVRPAEAALLALLLLALLTALGLWLRLPQGAWLCLGIYLAVNCAYSLGLKNVPGLDVALLASGFLLRVFFGAAAIGVTVSSWLYLTVIFVSFYMGFGKRRSELRESAVSSRSVLKFYTAVFLDRSMQLCMTLGIVFYSLWSAGTDTGIAGSRMLWTVPLAVCICLKYSRSAEENSDGDPVEILLGDRLLLLLVLLYAMLVLALLYF